MRCKKKWRNRIARVLVGGAAACVLATAPLEAAAAGTLVTAPDGTFQGKLDPAVSVREFLGLRYAQPPTGEQRWKSPQPVAHHQSERPIPVRCRREIRLAAWQAGHREERGLREVVQGRSLTAQANAGRSGGVPRPKSSLFGR